MSDAEFEMERAVHKANQRVIHEIWDIAMSKPHDFNHLKNRLYALADMVRVEMRLKGNI